MIDIKRVHDILDGKSYGKRTGKTWALLIMALGFADFEGPDVEIVALNHRDRDRLSHELCYIASQEMEICLIEQIRKWHFRIGRRIFKIGAPQPHIPEGVCGNPTFVDAYYRQDMRFMNCGMNDDAIRPHWKSNYNYTRR